jgi:hypothetical protein
MKELQPISFDLSLVRAELGRLKALLGSKAELSERDDIQPLFKSCPQLSAFIGTQIPGVSPADRIAFEFDVFGDFTADLVIGNSERKAFCAVEFEDARPNSVLHKTTGRATKEWGRRLEHGFGQLLDWFFAFDDLKHSTTFAKHFGSASAEFSGLLVIGRSSHLDEHDTRRLLWRSNRVAVNTHKVLCRTFDELASDLEKQSAMYTFVPPRPENPGA